MKLDGFEPAAKRFQRPTEILAYCQVCDLRIVLNADNTLPSHWPNAIGNQLCLGTGTRNHRTKKEEKTDSDQPAPTSNNKKRRRNHARI